MEQTSIHLPAESISASIGCCVCSCYEQRLAYSMTMLVFFFFFFKQKTAYEMQRGLVGSEMCIRDRLLALEPKNLIETAKAGSRVLDEICKFAGDCPIDLTYFPKRLVLVSIYARTSLFMMFDKSPNNEATWQFLKEQMNCLVDNFNPLKILSLSATDLPILSRGIAEYLTEFSKQVQEKVKNHKIQFAPINIGANQIL
eukprot:TRINITY_DN11462_c0_g1_i1.p1 TRINITY_DN11462_c0_g1~~TRINITY_DN11462_c0_g1_i1.p1  ORF type:complete len:199 (+),score=29.65 TRINITY_DN11462_c0_g1_i1:14-610(+)